MSSRIPLYGLGPPIIQTDGHIRGCHLPICEQVLRCYLFNCWNPHRPIRLNGG